MTPQHHSNRVGWRIAKLALGIALTSLGMYGAYQFASGLEGGNLSYLSIAAPLIAASAALIPPFAEEQFRQRNYLKCFLWWLVLIPAAATVFFSAAERVHLAKGSAEAQRESYRAAVTRAKGELAGAQKAAVDASKASMKAGAAKTCGPVCREAKATDERAQADVKAAEERVQSLEAKAVTESDLKMPEWLLPASLDLIAFMAIWSGLTGPRPPRVTPEPKAPREAPPIEESPKPVEASEEQAAAEMVRAKRRRRTRSEMIAARAAEEALKVDRVERVKRKRRTKAQMAEARAQQEAAQAAAEGAPFVNARPAHVKKPQILLDLTPTSSVTHYGNS